MKIIFHLEQEPGVNLGLCDGCKNQLATRLYEAQVDDRITGYLHVCERCPFVVRLYMMLGFAHVSWGANGNYVSWRFARTLNK